MSKTKIVRIEYKNHSKKEKELEIHFDDLTCYGIELEIGNSKLEMHRRLIGFANLLKKHIQEEHPNDSK